MPRPSTSLAYALALVACSGPVADGSDTMVTSEAPQGSSTTGTSEGGASPTEVGTEPDPTTADISSGSTSPADTSGSTSTPSSSTSTTEGTTEEPTETGGETPFKVGIALKSLCRPDPSSMCGVTPDDELACWGNILDDPSYQAPSGKLKAVGPHCFIMVLANGELHRLRDAPSQPVSLPQGPFVLAGGDYPYGCAMAANAEMTCWVADGLQILEEPPPGPYLVLDDARESNCQMCGIRTDGSLRCWKKPVVGDWETNCNLIGWNGDAQGTYTKLLDSAFSTVTLMNDTGQLVSYDPGFGGSTYVEPLFASGGYAEARDHVGLRQSGELLYFEKGMGDGVPVLPDAYTTFRGDQYGGCAIRQADSRVVCWGEGDAGQFDPPTE